MINIRKTLISLLTISGILILILSIILIIISKNSLADVTFETYGGNEVVITKKDKDLSDIDDPIKEGYIFKGWYDKYDCSGDEVTKLPTDTANVTIYAKWEPILTTISFDFSNDLSIADITQLVGTDVIAPNDPEKTGYSFVGWYDQEDLITEFKFEKMPVKDITLYPKWEINAYNVNVVTNENGTIEGAGNYEYKQTVTVTAKAIDGYTFNGWYTTKDYSSNPVCLSPTYEFTESGNDVTLYADFEKEIKVKNLIFSIDDVCYGEKINVVVDKNTSNNPITFLF